jgi:hypothetical protein
MEEYSNFKLCMARGPPTDMKIGELSKDPLSPPRQQVKNGRLPVVCSRQRSGRVQRADWQVVHFRQLWSITMVPVLKMLIGWNRLFLLEIEL